MENIKTLEEMIEVFQKWVIDRNIHKAGLKDQVFKMYEELGELSKAIIRNDIDEIVDAMGDTLAIFISLHMILSRQEGVDFNILDTLKKTYNIVKDRKGKMINGIFVKEEDLIKMGLRLGDDDE